jgi:hypothetical protein
VVDGRHGKTLEIGYKRNTSVSTHNEVVVLVHFSSLQAVSLHGSGDIVGSGLKLGPLELTLSGSGNVYLKDLSADRLGLSISGSGNVDTSGQAEQCTFGISGSGDVSAAALVCQETTVRIAGSGDARVQARKALAVSISGSGDVTYVGDPQVTSSIAGSGSVRRR